jgi:hypothetical protein
MSDEVGSGNWEVGMKNEDSADNGGGSCHLGKRSVRVVGLWRQ